MRSAVSHIRGAGVECCVSATADIRGGAVAHWAAVGSGSRRRLWPPQNSLTRLTAPQTALSVVMSAKCTVCAPSYMGARCAEGQTRGRGGSRCHDVATLVPSTLIPPVGGHHPFGLQLTTKPNVENRMWHAPRTTSHARSPPSGMCTTSPSSSLTSVHPSAAIVLVALGVSGWWVVYSSSVAIRLLSRSVEEPGGRGACSCRWMSRGGLAARLLTRDSAIMTGECARDGGEAWVSMFAENECPTSTSRLAAQDHPGGPGRRRRLFSACKCGQGGGKLWQGDSRSPLG